MRGLLWNPEIPYILLSGSWDYSIKVWNLKYDTYTQILHLFVYITFSVFLFLLFPCTFFPILLIFYFPLYSAFFSFSLRPLFDPPLLFFSFPGFSSMFTPPLNICEKLFLTLIIGSVANRLLRSVIDAITDFPKVC